MRTGMDRRTLKKRLHNVPTEDGKYSLSEVEKAIAATAKADGNLKDEKLKEEIRKLRIANDLKERELVQRKEVAAVMRKVLPEIPKILDQKLVQEAPTPEEKIRARKAIDEAVKLIAELEKDWAI